MQITKVNQTDSTIATELGSNGGIDYQLLDQEPFPHIAYELVVTDQITYAQPLLSSDSYVDLLEQVSKNPAVAGRAKIINRDVLRARSLEDSFFGTEQDSQKAPLNYSASPKSKLSSPQGNSMCKLFDPGAQ